MTKDDITLNAYAPLLIDNPEGLIYPDRISADPTYFPEDHQGGATEGTSDDYRKHDRVGLTHPDLMRDVHPKLSESQKVDGELAPREYAFGIYNKHSYRTYQNVLHDEESDEVERP